MAKYVIIFVHTYSFFGRLVMCLRSSSDNMLVETFFSCLFVTACDGAIFLFHIDFYFDIFISGAGPTMASKG